MTLTCSECGRSFGGVESFDRHFRRREDRCMRVNELRKAGMRKDALGVWRRVPPTKSTGVLPGMDKKSLPVPRRASEDGR